LVLTDRNGDFPHGANNIPKTGSGNCMKIMHLCHPHGTGYRKI
jgi:hypothetical protein